MAPTVSFVSSFHQQLFNRLKAGSETSNDSINLTDNCRHACKQQYHCSGFYQGKTPLLTIYDLTLSFKQGSHVSFVDYPVRDLLYAHGIFKISAFMRERDITVNTPHTPNWPAGSFFFLKGSF